MGQFSSKYVVTPKRASSGSNDSKKRKRYSIKLEDEREIPVLATDETSGLLFYVLSHRRGFSAIVKHLYTDYYVHEIYRGVLCTSSYEYSKKAANPFMAGKREFPPRKPFPKVAKEFYPGLQALFQGAMTDEELEKIRSMVGSYGFVHRGALTIKEPILDLEQRLKIHHYVRNNASGTIFSTTRSDNVTFLYLTKSKRRRFNRPARKARPFNPFKETYDYTHFTLIKENRGSRESLNYIADSMKRRDRRYFACTEEKPKRGVVLQRCSGYRVGVKRLKSYLQKFKRKNLRVCHVCTETFPVRAHDVTGHKYRIVLRDINKKKKDEIDGLLQEFTKCPGFVNYYGEVKYSPLEKVEADPVPSIKVGLQILKQNWLGAVELIMRPRAGEAEHMISYREEWLETKNSVVALSRFPKSFEAERGILKFYSSFRDIDCRRALVHIPRPLRVTYLHSLQRCIWNHVASARLARGFAPILGDIIKDAEGNFRIAKRAELYKYRITDVYLPLPFHDAMYPEYTGDLENIYDRVMEADGISVKDFVPSGLDFTLLSENRPLVIKPTDFSWEFLYYEDADDNITQDYERPSKVLVKGSRMAARLTFTLPPGVCATMLLRELMKPDAKVSV